MGQKDSLKLEEYLSLCDFDGSKYVQKSGDDYIRALSKIFPLNNKNDNPFTVADVIKQPLLSDFSFKGVQDFKKICTLRIKPLEMVDGVRKNEKIMPVDFVNQEAEDIFCNSLGVTYILTCIIKNKEYIIKIGCTRTPFKDRLQSYNCGVVNNWRTASTTNIKIVQSLVTTRADLNLYLCPCGDSLVFEWYGIKSVPFANPKYLAYEDILIKQFNNQFGHKPLANVQAKATEVLED